MKGIDFIINDKYTRDFDNYKNKVYGNFRVNSIAESICGVHTYWNCTCEKCNTPKDVRATILVNSPEQVSCKCSRKETSPYEKIVKNILDQKHFLYERGQSFPDLRYKKALSLDFYLPNYFIAIEYNGRQHKINEEQQKRDLIKQKYLYSHNIILLNIPENLKDEYNIKPYINRFLNILGLENNAEAECVLLDDIKDHILLPFEYNNDVIDEDTLTAIKNGALTKKIQEEMSK